MSRWKILACWFTRHHWLLKGGHPTNQGAYYTYFYQCQVCGNWSKHSVYNLDELKLAPNEQKEEAL